MLTVAARSTRRSRALAALVAGGLATGALALGAGPADAASRPTIDGACSTAAAKNEVARLCVRMHHTGLRVNWVEFVRTKRGGAGTIREHRTEVTLRTFGPDGDSVTKLMGRGSEGVSRGRVRVRQRVGLRLAPRTEVCGRFFERDVLQGAICFPLTAPRKNAAAA